MTHYICTGGCMGESPITGTCQATSCPKYGRSLDECECEDGRHPAQLEAKSGEGEEATM